MPARCGQWRGLPGKTSRGCGRWATRVVFGWRAASPLPSAMNGRAGGAATRWFLAGLVLAAVLPALARARMPRVDRTRPRVARPATGWSSPGRPASLAPPHGGSQNAAAAGSRRRRSARSRPRRKWRSCTPRWAGWWWSGTSWPRRPVDERRAEAADDRAQGIGRVRQRTARPDCHPEATPRPEPESPPPPRTLPCGGDWGRIECARKETRRELVQNCDGRFVLTREGVQHEVGLLLVEGGQRNALRRSEMPRRLRLWQRTAQARHLASRATSRLPDQGRGREEGRGPATSARHRVCPPAIAAAPAGNPRKGRRAVGRAAGRAQPGPTRISRLPRFSPR